ncbi:Peptidoglycan-binding (PGRP) domain of peptidoglycan hydrolases-containing protein [Streptomyces zhaozhouensis]|uniref:Peptidoglycan-binding (PGRP) domain of peptidoglycan hydrolases-containing protein n=1 Tax=Streptomyces zhaozhouensis TaxID=1300267 RepID=A0A286E0D9_9ACTN|nr:peptidoglycan-binding protein [Streptomyces zhaozhouensis]SOD64369.1 Peptidoglycan-binding (PGRP) domain of peptidoglycan hydrolases-containing protein [Streptomyces zhaozhouensis]
MTSLDQVPQLRRAGNADRPKRRPRVSSLPSFAPRRRTVLQSATVVGFATLGVFGPARQAYADGYDIWTGDCPSYASEHDCSPGCGPSTVHAAACETSGQYEGFHRNDGVTWTLRPNQCYSGSYDGWLWAFSGACGACGCGIERRCHDGYFNSGSGWVRSICRWTTDCGCEGTVTWPTLQNGSRGPDVHTAQHLVSHHGFTTEPDGIFGPNTATAVENFQESAGLTASGTVDPTTWTHLVVTVRQGDNGEAVSGAQRQLVKHGYPLTVDGAFGALTAEAAREFQRGAGLTVDGIVGQQTWRTLVGGA